MTTFSASVDQAYPFKPPYNPWESYLVEASAGSGKTWQLSRRFLALVIAGAEPSSILTVTFTKKAAAEMRERIIKDAVKLGKNDPDLSQLFDEVKQWRSGDHQSLTKLRSAADASRTIIAQTQTLKITTIDSIFLQWTQRFPIETQITIADQTLRTPWDILSNLAYQKLTQKAWREILAIHDEHEQNQQLLESLAVHAPNGNIRSLEDAIRPLNANHTFLWYIHLLNQSEQLGLYDVPETIPTIADFIQEHEESLLRLIACLKDSPKKQLAVDAVKTQNVRALVANAFLKVDYSGLNGTTFRAAKSAHTAIFQNINDKFVERRDLEKLQQLNHSSTLIWTIFEAISSCIHKQKVKDATGTFSDALKGCSILATSEQFVGARMLAWNNIQHLMLDEFQDTSRLQWLIFEKIAEEVLAGTSGHDLPGPRKSLFIVGDKKQSIYRFREAAPEVLDLARKSLTKFGLHPVEMSASFRSSSFVLNVVNQVFQDGKLIPNFPSHSVAAPLLKANHEKSTYGSLTIYQPCAQTDPADERSPKPHILEAELVARHILDAVEGRIQKRVMDHHTKRWRRPIYSDFAILYANSTFSGDFETALRNLGIPSRKEESKGFFARSEIKDLNALIKWLVWPADTVALATILRSPLCGLTDEVLQTILAHDACDIYEQLRAVAPEQFEMLRQLKQAHRHKPLTSLISNLITQNNLLARYESAYGPYEGVLARANVLKWTDLVRNAAHQDALSTYSWLESLSLAEDENETGNASIASNAVAMMTIHKSKGLEFPCVILSGAAEDWHRDEKTWIKDSRPGRERFWYIGNKEMRPSRSDLIDEILAYSEMESRQEKARLLYVALTRATHHIVVTGHQKPTRKSPGKDTKKSKAPALERNENAPEVSPNNYLQVLISNIKTTGEMVQQTMLPQNGLMIHAPHPQVDDSQPARQHQDDFDPARVAPSMAPTRNQAVKLLTVTALSKSLALKDNNSAFSGSEAEIPKTYKIPAAFGPIYGTLVHKILENHIQNARWTDVKYQRFIAKTNIPDVEEIERLLEFAKQEAAALLSSEAWQQCVKDAVKIEAEVPLVSIEESAMISSKIDLLIEDKRGKITIVDYKTIPVAPANALELARQRGYIDQVQAYCKILRKIKPTAEVDGLLLFTNPVYMLPVFTSKE